MNQRNEIEPKLIEMSLKTWKNVRTDPPKESGRYWCFVIEEDDLGTSNFQCSCMYSLREKRWSQNVFSMHVTHWTELLLDPS